jgi:hypothetical protein
MKLRRTARSRHRVMGCSRCCVLGQASGAGACSLRTLSGMALLQRGMRVGRGGGLTSQRGGLQEQRTQVPTVADGTDMLANQWAQGGHREARQCGPVLPRPRIVRDSRAALRGAQEAGRQAARVERHDLRVCIHTRLGARTGKQCKYLSKLARAAGEWCSQPRSCACSNMTRALDHQLELSSTNVLQSSAPGPASGR